ncbi:hypothetical protein Uis1B_2248 [Bifidobacterium margollesii]|uniref:Uncharacterized protein n=1 Tax=Bifidobacterium margollesii TaxID=2020964 RepID=A0A2N5J6T3_9BIFI|nr:hypothetical protein [Bifidobacterium margollesii]PLS29918.1 hypothetical protein Uis1B_2248 [Bifidobacterium margollesii]
MDEEQVRGHLDLIEETGTGASRGELARRAYRAGVRDSRAVTETVVRAVLEELDASHGRESDAARLMHGGAILAWDRARRALSRLETMVAHPVMGGRR